MKNSMTTADKDLLIQVLKSETLRLQQENSNLRSELRNLTCMSISEQKKAEKEIRGSHKLLLQIFNHTPLPIVILKSKDYSLIEANETFIARSGLTRSQVKQSSNPSFNDWKNPREFSRFMDMLKKDRMVKNFAMENRLPSGEIRNLILSAVIIEWQGEECFLIIGDDITELRKYENEMLHLSYLALINQVANGICRGIKNPMLTVRQFLQLFRSKEKYKADKKAFDLIIEELNQADDLIDTFSLLTRQKATDMKMQSLNDYIVNLFPLIMEDAVKKNVFIKLELSDTALIMMDEKEIWQLLQNLVSNGMEAMPRDGILTIGTFQDKNGVNLVIKDKGHGIPEEILEKIATPFFTTKEKRTGLGLSVCYSIAYRHNARIEMKTSPEGTSVYVIFPAAELPAHMQTDRAALA